MIPERPSWLRKKLPIDYTTKKFEQDLFSNRLHTICQEACCPNQGECFSNGVATFLIMGNICTRNCTFCAVSSGNPTPLDALEPIRLAAEIDRLDLRFIVVTSVTRDDLVDGGAKHFGTVIKTIRKTCPATGIEVLVPDFKGSELSLRIVLNAAPEVLNHNVETVPRLYSSVRPQADYNRSLRLLRRAKEMSPSIITKSGLMLGLGETREEVKGVIDDLGEIDCDILTIGQYLRPSNSHFPVADFVKPEVFDEFGALALRTGIKAVSSSPFVRSSYLAETHYRRVLKMNSSILS